MLVFIVGQMPIMASAAAAPVASPVQSVDDVVRVLTKIVGYVYRIFFIVAILFVLLAAYNFLFAQGNATKVKTAQDQILYAAIAIAVALISMGAGKIVESIISK